MKKDPIEYKIGMMKRAVEERLPRFKEMVERASEGEVVCFHQDAFAADYQPEEYVLLGMAIKYIGLSGKEIRIIGLNRSTLGKKK